MVRNSETVQSLLMALGIRFCGEIDGDPGRGEEFSLAG